MQNSNRRWTVTIVAALVAGATLANVNDAEAQIGDLIREAGIGLTVGFVEPLDDDVDGGPSWECPLRSVAAGRIRPRVRIRLVHRRPRRRAG